MTSRPWDTVTVSLPVGKSDALTQHAYLATQGHFGIAANAWFLVGIFTLIIIVGIWYVKPLVVDALARRIARRADLAMREAAGYVISPTMTAADRDTLPGIPAAILSVLPHPQPVIDVVSIAAWNSGGRWRRFDLADPRIHPDRETYGAHADTTDFRTVTLPRTCVS